MKYIDQNQKNLNQGVIGEHPFLKVQLCNTLSFVACAFRKESVAFDLSSFFSFLRAGFHFF